MSSKKSSTFRNSQLRERAEQATSVIGKNIYPTIERLRIALENVLSPAYVGNTINIMTDMGVNFNRVTTGKLPLKQTYIELLDNAEFHEMEKSVNQISSSTREFLREISIDKPKVKTFLEETKKYVDDQKRLRDLIRSNEKELKNEEDESVREKLQATIDKLNEDIVSVPVPSLTERIRWDMLTSINANYKQFRDMFLELEDDIPKRREEGWMNEIYLDFLDRERTRSKTLLQLEMIRENFDRIKVLRENLLRYHEAMKDVIDSKFLLGIKDEIDLARTGEKIDSITKKYKQMKKLVPLIVQNPVSYRLESGVMTTNTQDLKSAETFEDILGIARKTKHIIDEREKQRKKALEAEKNEGGFGASLKNMFGMKK